MIEQQILTNLVTNESFLRKTLPFLKEEYFHDRVHKQVFKLINDYALKYNKSPSKVALTIDAEGLTSVSEDEFKSIKDTINTFEEAPTSDTEWLVDETEKFCQDKAIYNAIMNSIQILDGKTGNGKGAIPQILSDALAVSFDTNIGHDFLENYKDRYDFYHQKEKRVPFDIEYLNKITKGGLPNKTLSVVLAGTGVGKSLFMCHCASANLLKGFNVLYITMEMAEEKIAERIDANTLNLTMEDLMILPRQSYEQKIERVRGTTSGKLIIKEYPTAAAGSANFRHLLNELKIKRGFTPDIIYIDYLNICTSSRMKQGANVNSYTYIKAIAEELRGLAVEFNVPIVTATQTTRSGYSNTDVGLEDTSESFGLPATADLMFALISTEELATLNQIMVKQLKNRHSDPGTFKRFVIGVDRARMKLYDVEQVAQQDLVDDKSYEPEDNGSVNRDKKFRKTSFEGFA